MVSIVAAYKRLVGLTLGCRSGAMMCRCVSPDVRVPNMTCTQDSGCGMLRPKANPRKLEH